jgi:ABC-type polysaccharide/polyol phosphate transport system ATPase subunit
MSSHTVSDTLFPDAPPSIQSESTKSTNEVAILLENVGVCYRAPSERFVTFKDYAIHWLQGKVRHREFWALRDINLRVSRGEAFGVIGQNGAGKSTLLKLVARVLRPTTGRVMVKGSIAPLLEFGAGFHPELTGRENVYLNGALLGFTHRQMEEKFTRIVDFAELWDFIDAPVRTYSSGMWTRLGFAVATDVEPDVLLIDEVLSVGDEAFQRKSSARMQEFRDRGATILLVTHNMSAIEQMCHRTAWIHHGKLMAIGESNEVIQAYRQSQGQ